MSVDFKAKRGPVNDLDESSICPVCVVRFFSGDKHGLRDEPQPLVFISCKE